MGKYSKMYLEQKMRAKRQGASLPQDWQDWIRETHRGTAARKGKREGGRER